MKRLIWLLVLIIPLMGCEEKAVDSSTSFSISGKLTNSYGPIPNAKVSVDNSVVWEAMTDEKGEFKINNVTAGKHTIKFFYTGSGDSFIERDEELDVNNNVLLNNVILPVPPHMEDPAAIGYDNATLIWSATDASDFREYKLYRKDSPGLDEKTGELIYVSTSRVDTVFIDTDLLSGGKYYYRVYIMNEYGALGGSNIVNLETTIGNIIPDGGFEDHNSLNKWQITRGNGTGYVTVLDDSVKHSGSFSLFNLNPDLSTSGNKYTALDSNFPVKLIPQRTYKLSGWAKAEGQVTDIGGLDIGIPPHVVLRFVDYGNMGDSVNIDWKYLEVTFQAPAAGNLRIHIYSPIEKIWLDDLSLILVQ